MLSNLRNDLKADHEIILACTFAPSVIFYNELIFLVYSPFGDDRYIVYSSKAREAHFVRYNVHVDIISWIGH